MAWARFGADTRSVSDVIGTVLLLGITTALFSVFSVAVLDQLDRNPPPSNVEFRVDANAGRTTMVLVWGESLEIEDARLLYELDGMRKVEMLSDLASPSTFAHRPGGLPTRWDLGESLRFACPAPETNCVHQNGKVANITVAQTSSNAVLFSSEPGVSPGSLVNPVPELVVAIQGIDDPDLAPPPVGIDSNSAFCSAANDDLYVGGSIVLAATISNAGIIPTPTGSTLTVSYYLDENPVAFTPLVPPFVRSEFLAAGESFITQNEKITLAAGPHSIRVAVTAFPAFTEATMSNNEATRNFKFVTGTCDPGQPYEDGDGDLLYNPYTLADVLIPTSWVTDGVHAANGSRNLTIPASVGTINPGRSIDFQSPNGHLVVGVTLQHDATPYEIRLNAGKSLNFTGAVDLRGRDNIQITAGGTINLTGIRLDNQDDDTISVSTTGGPIIANGTWFYIPNWHQNATPPTPPGDVTLTASHASLGYVDIRYARFDVDAGTGTFGSINVDAATNLYAQYAIVDAELKLDLRAKDTIRIEGASLFSNVIKVWFDLPDPNQVYVEDATIDDSNNCADAEPLNILTNPDISGTTALGRVETDTSPCV